MESFVTTLSIIVKYPEVPQLTVVVIAKAGEGKTAINAPDKVVTSRREIDRFFDLIFWPLLRITFTSFINP